MTDTLDRRILDHLRADGRITVRDIAAAVSLSPAAVSRRIAQMERTGVIRGYTALVDESDAGTVDAFVEVRLAGSVDTREVGPLFTALPEVLQVYTVAGDPDMLLHLRVSDNRHLQTVVNSLRATGKLAGTKTLIVLDSWVGA